MGSTRLPGKVMMKIKEKPMLWYSVVRTRKAKLIDMAIVVTSTEKKDDVIYDYCTNNGIDCYRGSEQDVLDRYYQAARIFKADIVVRITSDCPLIDPKIIETTAKEFLAGGYDYARTSKSWPNGIGSVEIVKFDVLQKIWKIAKLPGEREHVTPYIYTHPDEFKIKTIDCDKDYEGIVLSVDTQPQFDAAKNIIENLGKKSDYFSMHEILAYLEKNKDILKAIESVERRGAEQYMRDLKMAQDRKNQ